MTGVIGLCLSIALAQQDDLPRDGDHGSWECRRRIRALNDFKIIRMEAVLAQQLVGIVDLILAQQFKGRLQVLPQQVDLGWCEHPWFCRGSELPTG
mgnify:CR=1 FL=1